MLISSQPFTHNHHSVMRKQMTFCKRSIVQYLSVTNKDFFKVWEMLKHDFRFLHEIIIVSGGRGVSSVLSTYTKLTFFFLFFFLLWKRLYFQEHKIVAADNFRWNTHIQVEVRFFWLYIPRKNCSFFYGTSMPIPLSPEIYN